MLRPEPLMWIAGSAEELIPARDPMRLGPEVPAAAVTGEEHVSGIALIAVADTATIRAYLDSIAPLGRHHISRLRAQTYGLALVNLFSSSSVNFLPRLPLISCAIAYCCP